MAAMVRRLTSAVLVTVVVVACGSTLAPASMPATAPAAPAATSVPPSTTATVAPTASSSPTTPASPTATASPSPEPTAAETWQLVAVGDSIAYNSPLDCPGCTGFLDRYAAAIREATGHPVRIQNLSEHNGLRVDGLLRELARDQVRQQALAGADVIVVGIAHNSSPLNRGPGRCDGASDDDPDWSRFDAACVAEAMRTYRPKYEAVFEQVAALRAGKPTILRTLNRYDDWIGWPGHDLSAEAIVAEKLVLDGWNEMICEAAEANGFLCADIHAAFNGKDGLTPSGDLLVADYTHPSERGNVVIADTLIELGYALLAP
jgi:hypothetical protein